MPPPSARPFDSEAEFLTAEMSWVQALARYLTAKADREDQFLAVLGQKPPTKGQVASLKQKAERLREQIDAQVATSKAIGQTPALVEIIEENNLDGTEAIALLLATLVCLGVDLTELLPQAPYAIAPLSPGTLVAFLDLELAGQIQLRQTLGREGKLVTRGLLLVEQQEHPEEFLTTGLSIAPEVFNQAVGLETSDDSRSGCPCCGRAGRKGR